MLVERQRRRPGLDHPLADVAHQHRATPRRAGGAHHGVVDARRHQVEHARRPHEDRPTPDVAALAHEPVVGAVDVLQHVGLAGDHHALDLRTRLRIGARHRTALGRAVDERVDRRREGPPIAQTPPPPLLEHTMPRSTSTCWGAWPHPASPVPVATTAHEPPSPCSSTVRLPNVGARLRDQAHRGPRRVHRGEPALVDLRAVARAVDAVVHRRLDRRARRRRMRRATVTGGEGGRRRGRAGRRGAGSCSAVAVVETALVVVVVPLRGVGGVVVAREATRTRRRRRRRPDTTITPMRMRRPMTPVSRVRALVWLHSAHRLRSRPGSLARRRPRARARARRRGRRRHPSPLPRARPRRRDEARSHAGHRSRPGGRDGAPGDAPGHDGRATRCWVKRVARRPAQPAGRRGIVTALGDRPDRRHEELRPRDPGVGDARRARGRRGARGRRRLGAGARRAVVGGAAAWVRFRDGEPIRVSGVASLDDAHLSYDSVDAIVRGMGSCEQFLALARRCWRSRAFGDFWSHVLVADGSIDVAIEVGGLNGVGPRRADGRGAGSGRALHRPHRHGSDRRRRRRRRRTACSTTPCSTRSAPVLR